MVKWLTFQYLFNFLVETVSYVDKTNAPDNIYHGAVVVFDKSFDFILDKGIVIEKKVIRRTFKSSPMK